MAARITEPAVGASTWASGSQRWNGHIGIFTAKEAKKPSQSQNCSFGSNRKASSFWISSVPACQYIAMMASSISTVPVKL